MNARLAAYVAAATVGSGELARLLDKRPQRGFRYCKCGKRISATKRQCYACKRAETAGS